MTGEFPRVDPDHFWFAGYLKRPQTIALNSTFIALEVVVTILWLCSRRISKVKFMLSDIFIPLSLVVNLALSTSVFFLFRWIPGSDKESLSAAFNMPLVMIYYVIAPLYVCGVTFSRLSVLDLHHHIFIDKTTRYAVYVTGAIIGLTWLANTITILAQCQPIHELWYPVKGGWCNDIKAHYSWGILPNVVTNIFLLLIPIPAIYRLNTTWQRKMGIFFVFFIGVLGLAASIFCFVMFVRYSWAGAALLDATPILAWLIIEPAIYHLTACLITHGPVVRWVYSKQSLWLSRTSSRYSKRSLSRTDSGETTTTVASKNFKPFSNFLEVSVDDDQCSITWIPRDRGYTQCSAAIVDAETRKNKVMENYIMVEHDFEITQSKSSEEQGV